MRRKELNWRKNDPLVRGNSIRMYEKELLVQRNEFIVH